MCNVGLLYKVYIFKYVNVFKTIVFSVKNSKTMYMFLVPSKESVALVTWCPRIFSYCHIYVNILNEKYKKKAIPGNLTMRSIILLNLKNFSPLAKSRV